MPGRPTPLRRLLRSRIMSPVMARCPCGWPVADCLEHAPPSVDPYGLVIHEAPPPVAVTIAVGSVTAAAVVVIGSVAAACWAVGAVIDALKGRS